MAGLTTVPAHDVLPVGSRVSWGAIFAGAVIALATHFLLTLLGSAIGFSVGDDVRSETLGTGAAIWAIVATGLALLIGGWVTSRSIVGENKTEAAIHGIIMWGVVFAMILWLVASGVRAGFGAMVGVASAASPVAASTDWEAAARRAGVSQDQLAEWRSSLAAAPDEARAAANDPANRQRADEAVDTAARVTWWTLLGTLISMAAAVIGAILGSGPSMRLLGAEVPANRERTPAPPR